MEKVGIYSGTFDPIHSGHLAFAQEAIDQCGLDKVFFLVEPRPRRKQGVRAFEHRLEMVRLAIKGEPKFGSIVLEHQRFTPHETMPILVARFKGAVLYMLMGDDMLSHFADWPHVEELISATNFIIGVRHKKAEEVHAHLDLLQETRGLKLQYSLFEPSYSEYASSKVRLELRRGGQPEQIPKVVLDYIKTHKLYASA